MQALNQKDQLNHLYNQEIQLAEELHKLLKAEELALSSRDVEFIHNCTEKKHVLISDFEAVEQQRQELFEQSPYAQSEDIESKHETLQLALRSIQKQNRINAGIVSISQEFARQLLGIMRGIDHDKPTYNEYGKTANSQDGQYLAKV